MDLIKILKDGFELKQNMQGTICWIFLGLDPECEQVTSQVLGPIYSDRIPEGHSEL